MGGSNLGDIVAKKCFEMYKRLKKNGKPKLNEEWTLLSGIVLQLEEEYSVASLATGTKCIGQTSMSADGDVLNDSHAEVRNKKGYLL